MRKENSGRDRSRSYGEKKSGGFERGNFKRKDDDRKPVEGSSERPRKSFRDDKPNRDFKPERKRSYLGKSNEGAFEDRRKNFRDDRKQNEPPSFMHKKKYADRATKVEKNKRRFDFGQEFTNKEDKIGKEDFDNKKERRNFSGDKRKTFTRKESFGERREEKTFTERKPFRERERKDFRKDKKSFSRDRKPVRKDAFGETRNRSAEVSSGKPGTDLIRLNKYISNSGVCSRREADEMIEAGVISVNGEIITRLGTKISPTDVVKYNNETLRRERNVYVLLNKPKDYITTADDPEKRNTVMELIADACKERIYPVGRLDRNTTGVLLFTNDGELTKGLTHPSSNIGKIYHVELDKNVTAGDIDKIAAGIELEDGKAFVEAIAYDDPADKSHVGIELHSGKNRIVRRIFESLGYDVRKLDRVLFAGLTKKDLPRGRWRFLTDLEVSSLKMMTGKKRRAKVE